MIKTVIVAYMVLSSLTTEGMTSKVNEKIKDGWQPLGGINCQFKNLCYQAMVKKQEIQE